MSELLSGRAIPVRPGAVAALGATRAVVFQQLWYFGHGERQSDPEGWVRASLAEWSAFTGLSTDAVGRALAALVDSGHAEVEGDDRKVKRWRVAAEHLPRDRDELPRDRDRTAAGSRQAPLSREVEITPTGLDACEASFEAFWSDYPRRNGQRVGKVKARRQWQRLKPDERERAHAALAIYAKSCNGFPKDAERYLRDRIFDDLAERHPNAMQANVDRLMRRFQ